MEYKTIIKQNRYERIDYLYCYLFHFILDRRKAEPLGKRKLKNQQEPKENFGGDEKAKPKRLNMEKKIVYVDMDNVLVDFQSGINSLSEEQKEEYQDRYDETPNIFSKMKPLKGAIEGVELLAQHYEIYILSTAPWNNPSAWEEKLLWIKKYLGEVGYKRLILSHHKNLNKGDFLIDDREKNGAKEFDSELILFGSPRFPNWASVLKYLI